MQDGADRVAADITVADPPTAQRSLPLADERGSLPASAARVPNLSRLRLLMLPAEHRLLLLAALLPLALRGQILQQVTTALCQSRYTVKRFSNRSGHAADALVTWRRDSQISSSSASDMSSNTIATQS